VTDGERAQLKEYVERWARVGPLLERQREEEVRRTDTSSSVGVFGRLWHEALRVRPPTPTSGLIEQQRLFMKLRNS
jgi:hypothetical protein